MVGTRSSQNDLDGDGDQDLILGNLGENYKNSKPARSDLSKYRKRFDKNNGTNDVFLAKVLPDTLLVPIRAKECTSQQCLSSGRNFNLPFIRNIQLGPTILGKDIETAVHYKASMFSSVMLINDGEAQR